MTDLYKYAAKLVLLLFIFALILLSMGIYIKYGIIQADASYYLGVSKSMMEGMIPYKDFQVGYTPLSFYLMCIPLYLTNGSYSACLICLYGFHLLNAFLVFLICRKHFFSRFNSYYCALLSLLLCYYFGGEVYILEPFVLFFGLFSLYFAMSEKICDIIIAGFLCFCSFWSKQYGLGFFFLCLAYLLNGQNVLKKQLFLILGFAVGAIFWGVVLKLQGVSFESLISLNGSTYERKGGLAGIVYVWRTLFSIIPLLFVSLLLCILKWKSCIKDRLIKVSICALAGFMLQWYIRTYWHYLIYMMPFCVFILFKVSNYIKSRRLKTIYYILFCISFVRPTIALIQSDVLIVKEKPRLEQEEFAKEVLKIIPKKTKDVFGEQNCSFINGYYPPLFDTYGFSFAESEEQFNKQIKASRYYLTYDKASGDMANYLEQHFKKHEIKIYGSNKVLSVYIRRCR